MQGQAENKPAAVSERTKQAGENQARWAWVEPSVWTERMLTALQEGVKGSKWFSLMDKVYSKENLEAAYKHVAQNRGSAGVDHESIKGFERRLEENLEDIHQKLREDKYHPQAVRRVMIPKPGTREKRPLGIPTVRDRIVQTALRNVLEPIFERDFAEHSYGFRPGRGCKDALSRVWRLLKEGKTWVVDADLKGYFDTIPREPLMEQVKEKITDGRVLGMLEAYLKQGVMEGMKEWPPETGTPQGAVISPLLANIYLNPLDGKMANEGKEMVRYADDFIILCKRKEEAEEALEQIKDWV
jgi:RNA-directed DNA polymerase